MHADRAEHGCRKQEARAFRANDGKVSAPSVARSRIAAFDIELHPPRKTQGSALIHDA